VNAGTVCEGQDLLLSSSSAGASSYSWNGPNGFISGSQNPTITGATVAASGTYTVIASAGSCFSVASTVTVTVNANPTATASISTDTICSGNAVSLGATGGGSYSWTGPGAFVSTLQNPAITGTTVSNSGTYTVVVTSAGCTDTAIVALLVNQSPNAPLTLSDTTCVGDTLLLTASGTGTINWYSDPGLTTLVQPNSSTYSPSLPMNTTATYYVTSTDANGCTSSISTAGASNYNIVASAGASPVSGYIPLNVSFTNSSTGVDASDNYTWSINGNPFSTAYSPSYTFVTEGNYAVTMIATDNESGCTDTTALSIFADGEVTFTVPNIFTPNNDGSNDVFTIIGHGLTELHLSIYDRWGLKMYEFDGVHSSWDGRTTAGVEVSDGTYFYMLDAKGATGKDYHQNGSFMIMR
jgi:gliding motility-associated-like protein